MIDRWRSTPHFEGYESKIDARITQLPTYKNLDARFFADLGVDPLAATMIVAPTTAELHRGFELSTQGEILENPAMLVNIPSVLDPSMTNKTDHVFSLEAIFTPFSFKGGVNKR